MKILFKQSQKILLVVIPATLFISGISAYSSIVSHQALFEACKQRELNTAATLIQSGLQDSMNKAAARASIVVNLPSIKEAFRAGDRDKILERLLPAFLIQRDRYGVAEGQFHTAPAISFLRMYAPTLGHGEDLSSFREMVVTANKNHEPLKGLEVGRRGLSIRGIDLVKDDNGYIGSFEAGLSFLPVLEAIKKNLGFELGAFADDDMMSKIATSLPHPDAERIIAGLRNIEATDWKTLKAVVTPELMTSATDVSTQVKTISGIDYGIVVVPLKDYKGVNIGAIVAVQNFNVYQKQMSAAIVRAVAFSLLQVLVLCGILIVMINVMFVRPIATQEASK
jgi:hypothetical protein